MNQCINKHQNSEMRKICSVCEFDLRSDIPNVETLRKIMAELKAQFVYSIESIDNMNQELDYGDTINNQTEKTDYMDLTEIKYLIQDFRMDQYSPLAVQIQKLEAFQKILDAFESTDYLNW